MSTKTSTGMSLATALVVALASLPAHAQTGPELMLKPFAEGQTIEMQSDLIFIDNTSAGGGASGDIGVYDAQARWKLTGEDEHDITVGASATCLDMEGGDELIDQNIAVGFSVGEVSGWQLDAIAGVGHTGNNAYKDGQALYGMGDLIFTKQLDETSSVQVFVSYDGNRSVFPDVPLPGIAYNKQVSDELSYTLGLPRNSLTWRPADNARVDIVYGIPTAFRVRAEYDVHETVCVFVAAFNRCDAFVVDGDIDNRRVFFEQYRAEAGVQWKPCANFSVEVAGGYAFEQRLKRGFDTRSDDTGATLSDEPYLKIGTSISF